jgi:hypothetical protein
VRRPDIAVARAEFKPIFMARLELRYTSSRADQRSTFRRS